MEAPSCFWNAFTRPPASRMIALIGRHLCCSAAAKVAAMMRLAWSRLSARIPDLPSDFPEAMMYDLGAVHNRRRALGGGGDDPAGCCLLFESCGCGRGGTGRRRRAYARACQHLSQCQGAAVPCWP